MSILDCNDCQRQTWKEAFSGLICRFQTVDPLNCLSVWTLRTSAPKWTI